MTTTSIPGGRPPGPPRLDRQAQIPLPMDPEKITQIRNAVEADARNILGIAAAAPLPSAVQVAVNAEIQRQTQRIAGGYLTSAAIKGVSESLRDSIDIRATVASIAQLAADTAESIANDPQFLKSLEESAKIMKAKYDAYVSVGFSNTEAFSLLEAELYAKAGLRRR
jgi:hypothetical protein